jgi:glycine cleavage system aminomethyltransferase T
MKTQAILLTALMLSTAAIAADPKAVKMTLVDHSNALLISGDDAKAVMAENLPASVFKIHPGSRYAFVSQVEGGMKGGTCIVSARVMLVPLTAAAKAVLFRPQKMATAYDAVPNSGTDACKALAREKLKEATSAVASGIVKL